MLRSIETKMLGSAARRAAAAPCTVKRIITSGPQMKAMALCGSKGERCDQLGHHADGALPLRRGAVHGDVDLDVEAAAPLAQLLAGRAGRAGVRAP